MGCSNPAQDYFTFTVFYLVDILLVSNALLCVCVCVHRDARVVKDMATGKSKGYGFVSFFNKWVGTKMRRGSAPNY